MSVKGIPEIVNPTTHRTKQSLRADFNDIGRNLNANTTHMSLSVVMANKIKTDISLDSIESAPAIRHPTPLLHVTSCLKYSPFH